MRRLRGRNLQSNVCSVGVRTRLSVASPEYKSQFYTHNSTGKYYVENEMTQATEYTAHRSRGHERILEDGVRELVP